MTKQNLIALANAVASNEGFFDHIGDAGPNRPQRNLNPGDLRGWPGFPADPGGFTVFPSLAEGWNRLLMDITNHAAAHPNQTLLEFVAGDGASWPGYAPASDGNDSAGYALQLAKALGCSTSATFAEL